MSQTADHGSPATGPASDAAAGISGQAVGIGGDRLVLWSHPAELAVALADGTGWSADDVAAAWPERFAASVQPVGQQPPAAVADGARP